MTEQQLPQSNDMNSASPLSSSFVTSHRRPDLVVGPVVGSSSGSSVSSVATSASQSANNNNNLPNFREQAALQQQILQLKQQQHLQQQILLQQYQVQQQQLAQQHEKQLQEFLEQKKKAEEEARLERERHEKERLLALKNKEKREQSAVASSEVKQKLQEFVLNKKQREAAAAAAAGNGTTNAPSSSSAPYRAWTGAVPTLPAGHGCTTNKGSASQLSSGLGSTGSGIGSSNGVGGTSSSCSSTSSSGIVHPHPYRHPLLPGNFDDDFPLRKTASEPNLLKMRYKHRGAVERRNCSPLVARRRGGAGGPQHHLSGGSGPALPGHHHLPPPPPLHHRQPPPPAHSSSLAMAAKRMAHLTSQETGGSTPESPSGAASPLGSQHPSSGVVPVPEEISPSQYHLMASHGQGSISDLTLYSSPSLPNISLGRPAGANHHAAEPPGLAMVSEVVDMRAAFSVRMGLPATGGSHHALYQPPQPQHHHAHPHHQHHHLLMSSASPFFPPAPPDPGAGDYGSGGGSPESPGYIQKQMQLLEQAGHHTHVLMSGLYNGGAPITDAQVAQARLNKSGMRPLGRTQSAPLPLGHPLLQGAPHGVVPTVPLTQQQFDQYVRERQIYEQQHQHNLLKQHIRQTVLTRAGSRSHVENVEEETEAAVAHEMSRDRGTPLPEIIDLTEHKLEEETDSDRHSCRDGLSPLQLRTSSSRSSLHASSGSAFAPRGHHAARPLSRAFSSPLVSLDPPGGGPSAGEGGTAVVPMTLAAAGWGPSAGGAKTGSTSTALAYDGLMLRHQCMCGSNSAHPEHGGRLQSIWARLQETGAVHRCLRLRSRKATAEELQSVHSDVYTMLFGTEPAHRPKVDVNRFAELPMKNFVMLPCGGIGVDSDTTWNDIHTPSAARMAAGCVIDLAFKAAMGEIRNGFAIVRPPGHHAEAQQAMGFCFFNSVAIAAKQLRLRHKLERILIVDWDVHHGNGTQQIFYDDPRILYISIHRHDDGHFFPGTGNPLECGTDDGLGFNVNIAWSGGLNPPLGDAEYLAAFRALVMPIAQDFDPEIVLVSAGFDAATGHPSPLGGYQVSAACFGYMTRQLMELANGKLVMALEGGYDLPAICDASHECVRALLGDEPVPIRQEELARRPCQNAIDSLHKVISIQQPHWPTIKRYAYSVALSAYEVEGVGRSRSYSSGNGGGSLEGGEDSETLSAMAGLSVCRTDSSKSIASSSRELSQEPMDQDDSK